MGTTFYFQWEVDLMVRLQQIMNQGMITAAKCFTAIGGEIVVVIMVLLLYWCINKDLGIKLGVNLLSGLGFNTQLKNVFLRRRPYFDNPEIKCLDPVDASGDIYNVQAQGFSFPSMHSSNAAVLFGTVAREYRKKWLTVMAVVCVFCIGLSRVLLGNHYPTDVLVGWAVGLVMMFGLSKLQETVKEQWKLYLAILLLTLPGVFYATTNDYFTILGSMIGLFGGALFEEKKIRFRNTRKITHILCRFFFGLIIFLILDQACKAPFSSDFLNSGTMAAYLVRSGRYAIILFVETGLYPFLFNRWKILS